MESWIIASQHAGAHLVLDIAIVRRQRERERERARPRTLYLFLLIPLFQPSSLWRGPWRAFPTERSTASVFVRHYYAARRRLPLLVLFLMPHTIARSIHNVSEYAKSKIVSIDTRTFIQYVHVYILTIPIMFMCCHYYILFSFYFILI